jgi:DNA-binding transcriptional ArsR family regulator
MQNDNVKDTPEHAAMAEAAIEVLDTDFLRALCDPTRIQIIKKLILLGACDVSTVAKGLAQDRSVISRHLATLERAGIAASRKDGRRVLYDLDGPHNVAKVGSILEAIKPMAELCIPFENIEINEKGAA